MLNDARTMSVFMYVFKKAYVGYPEIAYQNVRHWSDIAVFRTVGGRAVRKVRLFVSRRSTTVYTIPIDASINKRCLISNAFHRMVRLSVAVSRR